MPGESRPIAVVGSGEAGIATLIDTIVRVAYATPDGVPARSIVVIDTRDRVQLSGNATYPLEGMSPARLHPFSADEPPTGFPTFGDYVEQMYRDDPALLGALRTPSCHQIREYLDYTLQLASISFADQVSLEVRRGAVREIEQAAPDQPAVIHFVDGTTLSVAQVIHAKQPPHLAGSVPGDRAAVAARRQAPPAGRYPPGTRDYFWERIVGGSVSDADATAMLEFITQAARTRNGGTAPRGAASADDSLTLGDFKQILLDMNERGDAGERAALAMLVGGDCAAAERQCEAAIAGAGDDPRQALWSKGALFVTVDPAVTRDAWERLVRLSPGFDYALRAHGRLLERLGKQE